MRGKEQFLSHSFVSTLFWHHIGCWKSLQITSFPIFLLFLLSFSLCSFLFLFLSTYVCTHTHIYIFKYLFSLFEKTQRERGAKGGGGGTSEQERTLICCLLVYFPMATTVRVDQTKTSIQKLHQSLPYGCRVTTFPYSLARS